MSSKIHHNTVKKAKKAGIELAFVIDGFTASKDGVQLAANASASVALDQAIAKLIGASEPLARIAAATKAIAKAAKPKKARKLSDEDDEEGEEDEEFEDSGEQEEGEEDGEGRSIIKRKYKERYRPFKMTCGDDLAQQVAAHLKVKDDTDGKARIDAAKLKRFAVANECWDPKYAHLNVGLRRMNCVNRLRAKIRKGHAVVWAA